MKFISFALLLAMLFVLAGCAEEPDPTPEPEPTPLSSPGRESEQGTTDGSTPIAVTSSNKLLISEVLVGVPGSNNQEFVELYNSGQEAADLDGWSLWYLTNTGQEEDLIFQWEGLTEIPGLGHYLLGHEGKAFDPVPDATFSRGLFEGKGGLILRDENGEVSDRLGWGDAPEGYYEGNPVSAPESGASLERSPGGEMGNGADTDDNSADMSPNPDPGPQNTGSPPTPLPERRLAITMDVPESVEPGVEFDVSVSVKNLTGGTPKEVEVTIPLPPDFSVVTLPGGASEVDGRVNWPTGEWTGERPMVATIRLKSPFTYSDSSFGGYHVTSADTIAFYGPPLTLSVSGGAVPIATARGLLDFTVTIEGVATMYTGGFFAGSNTKFYLEDDSGGVQVFVPALAGSIDVDVGDRLRVTGHVEVYRDSIEIVPADVESDIEVLDAIGPEPEPTPLSVVEHESESDVIGRLNEVEGTITLIEEFTYSYEISLFDDNGNQLLVFIEKDTGVTAELLEVDKRYRVRGVSEYVSGQRQLKPRVQSDIQELYPPILILQMAAGTSVAPGDPLTYTITAINYTDGPLTNLFISAVPVPSGATATLGEILDGGILDEGRIIWSVNELAGQGTRTTVRYTVQVGEDADAPLLAEPATVTAEEWPEPVLSEPFQSFVGPVPIWAIQGSGRSSPYVQSEVETEGIVTGVFPGLLGFWIQEPETDDDPSTSEGLFVLIGEAESPVEPGDVVQVKGVVRELHGQTTLQLAGLEDVVLLSSGNQIPAPVVYDPPEEIDAAAIYKESLAGMLVEVNSPAVVVAPTTNYGEYGLVYESWGVNTVRRDEEVGYIIFVDDGATVSHQDQSTLDYAVQRGDMVTSLVGILAYTFGEYKIEPIMVPEISSSERPLPSIPSAGENELIVATFNVENLFDILDPHPSSPPRPNGERYRLDLDKVADAIVRMGAPAILGLQEVENIGILEDLVELEQLAPFGYEPYLIEGTDSRGIDNAYLVRSDQVTVQGVTAYPGPNELTSRPPLVMTATIQTAAGSRNLFVLNNHFLSLSAGVEATEPVRTAQAAWNVTLVEQLLAGDPAASVIVMGDLNSFYDTLPIHTLQDAGLRHLYEFVDQDGAIPYTYIFEGKTQTLDHILLSADLFDRLVSVEVLHIDADYPIVNPDDASARRVSDHDPVIARFSIGP